ncbi:DUF3789 domain-containing protein [Anaerostipes faecalis]|uniref:DUF3789 domain-containing protein n=1 Tax=Anaerostipes faecalis TaxID=2738446 RepID=UPI001C1E30FB|nr:DUF3789 domain-containing protein [Anaerostipes faecalis]
MGMISVFAGAMVGGCFGVIITCLAVAGKRADEECGIVVEERYLPAPTPPRLNEHTIRFTDPDGVYLFSVPDGSCVFLTLGNGESVAGFCRYVDQDHAEIDGVKWQLKEFARQMQERGITVSPGVY